MLLGALGMRLGIFLGMLLGSTCESISIPSDPLASESTWSGVGVGVGVGVAVGLGLGLGLGIGIGFGLGLGLGEHRRGPVALGGKHRGEALVPDVHDLVVRRGDMGRYGEM